MKIAFVFPGQGSQAVGMAAGFADNAAAAAVMKTADAALGESLSGLIAEGPAEKLNLTVNTQPAVLSVSYALYSAWLAAGGVKPAAAAGHSLGEYTALLAAGTFTLEEAVKLVRFRAEAMQSAVPVGVGGMAAIIGLTDEAVEKACAEVAEGEVVEPVNFNSPGQVVIAGNTAAVARACEKCKAAGAKRALPLAVSGPFHSKLLAGAAEKLGVRLSEVEVKTPAFDVIANVDAAVHTAPDDIRTVLARQAASPVQWVKTVHAMKAMGVTHVVECGPGKVLTGLIRRVDPTIETANISSVDAIAALLEKDGFRA